MFIIILIPFLIIRIAIIYLTSQVPGGRIAELFSGKWVFFCAVLLNVFGTLATPFASNLSYIALIFMRILEGFGGGVTFPAMNVIIAAWAPDSERSTISSLIYGGNFELNIYPFDV